MQEALDLAVNGTLMRGLELNRNLLAVGATFLKEDTTEAAYRLWSIDDRHPAMLRVAQGGAALAVEVWRVPLSGIGLLLLQEPPGLCVGRVCLSNGAVVLGVLAEPILCENKVEITHWRGWHAYMQSLAESKN